MKTRLVILLALSLILISAKKGNVVCIYGGSSACVTAAYAAAPDAS